MNIAEKSIFNLIEIFRGPYHTDLKIFSATQHCEQKHHHDFYCDAEKPFITNS
ncbi:Hypothetical protein I595_1481 [Croceitalea dokdonensis DOKDO 023]|uniref:Uncharacterized protein n=1 Tax=Croceitalea dokdonensis DOKDO 023 TaxID=1300341 RepID=A0A0P7B1L7_9FLAO|nr:hypothetical protein [Croceitalea dokdonensis]KPM33054.1 Hypothetical protein I595_1481 [Croceitalea dokdonensis DOKDO 023]